MTNPLPPGSPGWVAQKLSNAARDYTIEDGALVVHTPRELTIMAIHHLGTMQEARVALDEATNDTQKKWLIAMPGAGANVAASILAALPSLSATPASPAERPALPRDELEATIKGLKAERDEALGRVEISLDKLPFWPWLWADPALERGDDQIVMAEVRLRANYETARAPIPGQYALVHRWDLVTLMHKFWRFRARSGLLDDYIARAQASEARANALQVEVERLRAALDEIGAIKFNPVAHSARSTGPALLMRRAQEIARAALTPSKGQGE